MEHRGRRLFQFGFDTKNRRDAEFMAQTLLYLLNNNTCHQTCSELLKKKELVELEFYTNCQAVMSVFCRLLRHPCLGLRRLFVKYLGIEELDQVVNALRRNTSIKSLRIWAAHEDAASGRCIAELLRHRNDLEDLIVCDDFYPRFQSVVPFMLDGLRIEHKYLKELSIDCEDETVYASVVRAMQEGDYPALTNIGYMHVTSTRMARRLLRAVPNLKTLEDCSISPGAFRVLSKHLKVWDARGFPVRAIKALEHNNATLEDIRFPYRTIKETAFFNQLIESLPKINSLKRISTRPDYVSGCDTIPLRALEDALMQNTSVVDFEVKFNSSHESTSARIRNNKAKLNCSRRNRDLARVRNLSYGTSSSTTFDDAVRSPDIRRDTASKREVAAVSNCRAMALPPVWAPILSKVGRRESMYGSTPVFAFLTNGANRLAEWLSP